MMAEVTTIPTVEHAEVRASYGTEVVTTSIVEPSSAYHVPGMSTAIAGVEHWASEVEVVAMRIAGINAEVPETIAPVEWAIEIASCTECLPLPVEQNVTHIQVTTLPVSAIYIVIACHPHQVVEVDFIGSLVLFVGQVQLISHLVRQEQCLVACLFVAHCLARCCYRQHCYQGYHYLLHHRNCYMFTVQKYEENDDITKDFP